HITALSGSGGGTFRELPQGMRGVQSVQRPRQGLANIPSKEQDPPLRRAEKNKTKKGGNAMQRVCLVALLSAAVGALVSSGVRAQTCAVNVPHVNGTWVVLPYQMPINPIQASVLRNGKVLIVAGSENDAKNNSEGAESYRAAIWDPTGTTEGSI